MANLKISQLTAYTNPATTDVLPIVDAVNSQTKKVSVGEVVGKISGDITVATDGTSAIAAGVIVDADINASAAIADTKLATISTAGKVSNSATTATSANTASAIVARDASGNFTASTITANLTGTASAAPWSGITDKPTTIAGYGITDAVTTGSTGSVTSTMILDGTILNVDINASAAIADTKLATISTAGKVSNSATTATSANTASAIVARDSSGNFNAGTASLTKVDLTGTYVSNIVAMGALNIDCSAGVYFTKTINGNSTFTVSNVPASRAFAFTLELTHTSGTVTWFSGVQWPGGTAPTLTTGKVHLFTFVTDDGGTSWRGSSQINYSS